ncbi:arsenate-mycothiol transferase [Rhodococcus sp. 27YEA15]|uniref:arsenate-mycothiol transferase ArsC n=1 Tax=Rhodococcus sp. 27YEA15 TaxID=3156259 RepID=UPI003C7D3089
MAERSVLFVCVKNGGKSQMAAGLMKQAAGDAVDVHSAGTEPGSSVNALSVEVLLEVGIDIRKGSPKPLDPQLVSEVDLVITLGTEATVEQVPETAFENWAIDEPSLRGIDGIERMRLVREDISARVTALAARLRHGVSESDGQDRPRQRRY